MSNRFEGFEKSAPKGIPSTKVDPSAASEEVEEVILGNPAPASAAAQVSKAKARATKRALSESTVIPPMADAQPAEAEAEAEEQAPKKRKRVEDSLPKHKLEPPLSPADKAKAAEARVESAWDMSNYPTVTEFAKAFVDHTEGMITRVLAKEAEIVAQQQKILERLNAMDDGEFNKKDAAFFGIVMFVLVVFSLLYLLGR